MATLGQVAGEMAERSPRAMRRNKTGNALRNFAGVYVLLEAKPAELPVNTDPESPAVADVRLRLRL